MKRHKGCQIFQSDVLAISSKQVCEDLMLFDFISLTSQVISLSCKAAALSRPQAGILPSHRYTPTNEQRTHQGSPCLVCVSAGILTLHKKKQRRQTKIRKKITPCNLFDGLLQIEKFLATFPITGSLSATCFCR